MKAIPRRHSSTRLRHLLVALALFAMGCASEQGARRDVELVAPPSARQFIEAEASDALVQAVDQRLEIMRDVAAAKWISGAPILDPAREAVVLHAVGLRAEALGLDAAAVQAYFATQISLAREMQAQWHAQWKAAGLCGPCDEPARLQATRERIDAASESQLAALYVLVPLRAKDVSALAEQLRNVVQRHGGSSSRGDELSAAANLIKRTTNGSTLERIKATGRLRVATTGDYAPFSLEANDQLSGADVELALQLARHLGVEATFVRTSWPGLTDDLRAGRFDVALSGIGFTDERAALGAYSAAYHQGGKTLLARCVERERFDTPEELDRVGNRVIVNPGGTNERYVREHVSQAQVIVHPDNRGVFAEIAAGRADVMVTDDVEADLQARRWPGQLCRTYAGTLTQGEKRILMTRAPALQAVVDHWLQEQIAAGEPARLLEQAMQ